MQETKALHVVQQALATEIKEEVTKIGLQIQEQSQKTLLQEQIVKEQED